MKRLILALAIFCMAGAAFLGVTNKQTRDDEIKKRKFAELEYRDTNDQLNVKKTELAEAVKSHKEAEDANNKARADLATLEQSLKRQQSSVAKNKEELEKIAIQQKEIDLAVAKLDGITSVEELIAKEKGLQDTLAEKTAVKVEEEGKLSTATKMRNNVQAQVIDLEKKQIQRAKEIALNGLEATVVAVNKDWGFVMVNAGMSLGVSGSSSLLVKRGEELIARLRIVTLAPDMVVCDVVAESIAKGARVMPGDRAIFESLK